MNQESCGVSDTMEHDVATFQRQQVMDVVGLVVHSPGVAQV